MPTDGARTNGKRLALGAGATLFAAILIGWPLGFVAAVFVAMFLQAPGPMPAAALRGLLTDAVVFLGAAWIVAMVLAPYPVVFLSTLAIAMVFTFYRAVSGAGALSIVLALMGVLMIPNLVLTSPQIAASLVWWLPVNMAIAGIVSWQMFALIPPAPIDVPTAAPTSGEAPDVLRLVLRMSLVAVPFALIFYVSSGGAILTLIFVAILSQQLANATAAGPSVARSMLKGNAVGGLAAIVAYEVTVIAPILPVACLVSLLLALSFGFWISSGRKDAALAGSALTTAIILYGGSVAPFGDEADTKMLARLFQVAAALGFVIAAFLVVDALVPLRRSEDADDPENRDAVLDPTADAGVP